MLFVSERKLMSDLNLSRTVLWQLRKQGMPFFRIGRTIRYDMDEVVKWLENHSKHS